jgi:hypothetical protein
MRIVDPTLPRDDTDLMTLRREWMPDSLPRDGTDDS